MAENFVKLYKTGDWTLLHTFKKTHEPQTPKHIVLKSFKHAE